MKKVISFVAVLLCICLTGCVALPSSKFGPDVKEAEKKVEEADISTAVGTVVEEAGKNAEKSATLEAVPKDVFKAMSAEERRVLNVFLSNFSEAYLESFDALSYNKADVISFAFVHNNINNSNKIKYVGNEMGISYADANATLQRYMGITVSPESYGEWTYKNGGFYTTGASGETYARFSIASDMVNNGDGTYDVAFSIFFDDDNGYEVSMPQWYTYSVAEASSKCTLISEGRATVKKKVYNGKNTYELIRYSQN